MIRARVATLVLAISILCVPIVSSSAQNDESIFERIKREHESIEKGLDHESLTTSSLKPESVEAQSIDVKHYKLQILLTPEPPAISGTVTISAETTATVNAVNIDAQFNLNIDSVTVDGALRNFSRSSSRITIGFSPSMPAGGAFTISIQYHGVPITSNSLGGGMLVVRHGPSSTPVIANLSEPFAAPTWWPCIDNPADKATAEIEVTAPEGYQAASNGVLDKARQNPDRTSTYFWREDSPLSTYLVSVAATNYARFDDTYTALDGVTTMPLVYLVYPEHLDLARLKFPIAKSAMQIFARLYAEYPFLGEKYGMAEFPFGGAMEHQTMTSIGSGLVGSPTNSGQATIAHELAHQWWGDLVTMRTWDDIWLNEGFATYSEVLFFERYASLDPGELMSRGYDDGEVFGKLGGTVTAENPDNPFDDRGAIYSKGAWVLHMLRHILGDQKFFDGLKTYRSRYAFSNASTQDLQRVFEQYYGSSLDWFFQQWIYAPGRPLYKVTTDIGAADASGNYPVTVVIKQKQPHDIPGRDNAAYIMPIDITIHYSDGASETRIVIDQARKQKFRFSVSKQPVDAGIDEMHWILKQLR